ncbi:MAG: CBS domain-containing protein [Chloroflexi bacterium]|nr:CBS domain-containing protein [Chloroflexota bacterium]BCY17040.1 CBS domain-containing protein [Leptolinea sp. HRD-7]
MKNGIIRNWMSSPVKTISPDTRLFDARKMMDAEKIRALPVMKDGKLVGIVTRRGLLRTDIPALNENAWTTDVDLKDAVVEEIMTKNPITVPASGPLPKAARVMLENKITAIPVVDDNRAMVGIITTSDIFRFILAELPDLKLDLRARDYMTSHVVTLGPDDSLLEAHRLMGAERIRALPVVEDGQLKGIITRTDLLSNDNSRFLSRNNQEESLKVLTNSVSQIMITNVITITPETTLLDAARLMLENKFHSLPVLDAEKKLVGILTESDLFRMVIQRFF